MNNNTLQNAIFRISRILCSVLMLLAVSAASYAQSGKLTKEQILSMSMEELSELPLEELMEAVETLGVSSVDELFALIMNKNVASASKKEESSFTAPLSTTTITRNELRTYGVTTIEEAFRLVPGVVVQEKTNGMYDVYIRGLNNIPDGQRSLYAENTNTLLMVDGRILNDYMCGMLPWETLQISIEDVERIEVVRGATSALYGQNAIQGVINIITDKRNSSNRTIQGSLQMGNNESFLGDVALRTTFSEKLKLGLTFNIQQRNRNTNKILVPKNAGYFYNTTPEVNPNVDPSGLVPIDKDTWFSVEELGNTYNTLLGKYYNNVEEMTPLKKMFPKPEIARSNFGFNGYFSYNHNENVGINLMTGYQQSESNTSSIDDDIFVISGRYMKNYYANMQTHFYGLSFNVDFANGANDYVRGVHSYKEGESILGATLGYDLELGDLSIRPEVQYRYFKAKDYHYFTTYPNGTPDGQPAGDYFVTKDGTYVRITPFFDGKGTDTYTVAPSLRLDYKLNSWRFIGAFRSDKTDKPDKWNNSWQLAISKQLNDKNFVRLSYGRATRASVIINSDAHYTWTRKGMSQPNMINLFGTMDYDLVSIDNFELGYRVRPTSSLLIDAEAFYSMSENFGSLHAHSAGAYISQSDMMNYVMETIQEVPTLQTNAKNTYMQEAIANGMTSPEQIQAYVTEKVTTAMSGYFANKVMGDNSKFKTVATMQYNNVPYKVKQYGVSVNMDWIISPKLIAKFNLNFQQTNIDDYYRYDSKQSLSTMLSERVKDVAAVTTQYLSDLQKMNGDQAAMAKYLVSLQNTVSHETMAIAEASGDVVAFGKRCYEAYWSGKNDTGVKDEELLGTFYLYNLDVRKHSGDKAAAVGIYNEPVVTIGREDNSTYTVKNNHKHEATPSAYGMIGLIYKPIKEFTVSAFGNFIGKRNYNLSYGDMKMDPRFTMNLKLGYSPIEGMEVFFNAHNLFNTEKQEYPGMDKIGGLYTFGVNFGF